MTSNYIDRKVEQYIEKLFADVGKSQQLIELKEELTTNMKEKVRDYTSRGMNEEEAFKEAVVSMGDLSGLVEDMRQAGQESAKQSVYSSMSNRISTGGIIIGVMLILFGVLNTLMLYFMGLPPQSVVSTSIFVVPGGVLIVYAIATRETKKKYGMGKARATLFAVSIGLILFGFFAGATSGFATNEAYVAVASSMVFLLMGIGLLLWSLFTGVDRRKKV
ncbi:permease prefix domain 1-containing protein [Salsuginibacillus kocurii]|uniref:permease prefix domain 1-containing protein n=1 Tax=Salsuginibacillus kocurii TaxID=427078 RepID=UPI00036EE371|nr:permease prefix domain 1-containing protein [Salsuginibacillus kocurii]